MNPELIPIKKLKSELKIRISCRAPRKLEELMQDAIEGWKNIPLETYANLVKHYRKRLKCSRPGKQANCLTIGD